MDRKFFLYTHLVICFMWIIVLLYACANSTHNSDNIIIQRDQKIYLNSEQRDQKIYYLNSDSTVYTRGDTIMLDGRKFIKVWGITHCKYGCPVLIECK